jgi:hypothetical protein
VVTRGNWQKSSFSGSGDGNNCLELAVLSPNLVGFRESDAPTVVLTFAPVPLTHLLRRIRNGGDFVHRLTKEL